MKKAISVILSIILLLSASPAVFAGSDSVRVQIAPWYTQLDNMSVYNGAAEYPFLVYKGITYLPLTYKVCVRLGLMTDFDADEGFYIANALLPFIEAETEVFGKEATNYYGTGYIATIPSYPIYLNGIRVDSSKEEYPFLNFRGITYLPLTYKFAVEELNLSFTFSKEENSFRIYNRKNTNYYGNIGTNPNGEISVIVQSEGYTEYNENGQTMRFPYFWFDDYIFHEKKSFLEKTGSRLEWKQEIDSALKGFNEAERPECDALAVINGKLFYNDTELLLSGEYASSVYGYEYDIGEGKSLVLARVSYRESPSPYAQMNEYLYLKDSQSVTRIGGYDSLCLFDKIYPDGYGGAYICTSAYRPVGFASRWIIPHSTIYRLSSDGTFYDMCESYPDINSIRAAGMHDGKLYVTAMNYYYGKSFYSSAGYSPFSPLDSGFYCIDTQTDGMTKLYAYAGHSEAFVTENGGFYIFAEYANKARIINLKTGVISEVY